VNSFEIWIMVFLWFRLFMICPFCLQFYHFILFYCKLILLWTQICEFNLILFLNFHIFLFMKGAFGVTLDIIKLRINKFLLSIQINKLESALTWNTHSFDQFWIALQRSCKWCGGFERYKTRDEEHGGYMDILF